ncbi:hypothetical protein ACWC5I_00570 [Kitasatospora sp. NPDC001574]
MAQEQQKLSSKQVTGQLITHTIVKPLAADDISIAENEQRAAALDEADTASE